MKHTLNSAANGISRAAISAKARLTSAKQPEPSVYDAADVDLPSTNSKGRRIIYRAPLTSSQSFDIAYGIMHKGPTPGQDEISVHTIYQSPGSADSRGVS